ncbi:hypothetical protein GCM10027052_09180 [Parafrigoribacterium mesophilum]|uniref:MFS transporter n=1 Tax=Parafrigoribacterium mesophilum TaxID=433646 RepID=UPI0031FCA07F
MTTPTQHLYLIRHGQTTLNAEGRLRGLADPPLDETGLAEARNLAAVLAGKRPSMVLSSPLQRAVRTAELIAEAAGAPCSADGRFNDRDYGPRTGEVKADVVAEWGSVDDAPGVEALSAVLARVRPALDAVLDAAACAGQSGPVVVVTHDAVIRPLIASIDPNRTNLEEPTGCWNHLARTDGVWTVIAVDQKPAPGPEATEESAATAEPGPTGRWFTLGVGSIGLTSFFSDSGHEIATALLPGLITSVLHSSAAALGLIEGISDAFVGIAKLVGGPLADDPKTRGRVASGGYVGTAVATGAIGLATAVWQVGVLRGIAWAARGLRSPARDSLLTSLTPRHAYGKAFGIERAGDNLGAVVGPLLAALLVSLVGIRPAIWFAAIPGLLAAAAITVATRQAKKNAKNTGQKMRTRLIAHYRNLRGTGLLRVMIPVALFEAGNLATTLLILRSTQLLETAGYAAVAAVAITVLIYAAHNAVAAIMAFTGGAAIDRFGPRVVLAAGAGLYVLAYAGFAAGPTSWGSLLILFALAGCGIGFAETAESTLIAHALPENLRGTGFGMLGLVQAGGDLVATVVAGILYTTIGAAAGFGYAAAWMLLATIAATAGIRWTRAGATTPRR